MSVLQMLKIKSQERKNIVFGKLLKKRIKKRLKKIDFLEDTSAIRGGGARPPPVKKGNFFSDKM